MDQFSSEQLDFNCLVNTIIFSIWGTIVFIIYHLYKLEQPNVTPLISLILNADNTHHRGEESLYSWGLFHKTLQIRKLQICSYGQILIVNLLINCKNSVIYSQMAVNYEGKSFMEQVPGLLFD